MGAPLGNREKSEKEREDKFREEIKYVDDKELDKIE